MFLLVRAKIRSVMKYTFTPSFLTKVSSSYPSRPNWDKYMRPSPEEQLLVCGSHLCAVHGVESLHHLPLIRHW